MTPEEFLKCIVKCIVKFSDDVKVEETSDEMGILLSLSIAKADMGIIIGKSGVNIQAIKKIMRLYGFQNDSVISIRVNEPKE